MMWFPAISQHLIICESIRLGAHPGRLREIISRNGATTQKKEESLR